MKERPILFNGEMVRAILDSKKTQTRRVIKANYISLVENVLRVNGKWVFDTLDYELTTPYGRDGDRLWVRETWASEIKNMKYAQAKHEGIMSENLIFYRATDDDFGSDLKWHPSIYMPRWASRIDLEIINIRVERVQEVSIGDILCEGIVPLPLNKISNPKPKNGRIIKKMFINLWDSINANRGFGWDTNPYVWVIEFKKI